MSQAKVDAYKESKRNRKHDIAKAKRMKVVYRLIGVAVCAAVGFWIGLSSYNIWKAAQPIPTYELSYSAIDDYLNNVLYATEEESDEEAETDSSEDTAVAEEDTVAAEEESETESDAAAETEAETEAESDEAAETE